MLSLEQIDRIVLVTVFFSLWDQKHFREHTFLWHEMMNQNISKCATFFIFRYWLSLCWWQICKRYLWSTFSHRYKIKIKDIYNYAWLKLCTKHNQMLKKSKLFEYFKYGNILFIIKESPYIVVLCPFQIRGVLEKRDTSRSMC